MNGLGKNCSLLLILIEGGSVGSTGDFVAGKCGVVWFGGLAGAWLLLSAVIGSVLTAISFVVIFVDGFGRSAVDGLGRHVVDGLGRSVFFL